MSIVRRVRVVVQWKVAYLFMNTFAAVVQVKNLSTSVEENKLSFYRQVVLTCSIIPNHICGWQNVHSCPQSHKGSRGGGFLHQCAQKS